MPAPELEVWLFALTVLCTLAGSWGILWVRASSIPALNLCGRSLFLGTLVFMGLTCLVAAFYRADGLIYLGLSAGFLVIVMLWEIPAKAWQGTRTSP
jgi:hypothetical protein